MKTPTSRRSALKAFLLGLAAMIFGRRIAQAKPQFKTDLILTPQRIDDLHRRIDERIVELGMRCEVEYFDLAELKPTSMGASTMVEWNGPKCALCNRNIRGTRPWAWKSRATGCRSAAFPQYYCSERCAMSAHTP